MLRTLRSAPSGFDHLQYLGDTFHDDFAQTSHWTIAADYRGDQVVFAVEEATTSSFADGSFLGGTGTTTGSSASTARLLIGGLSLETLDFSGLHTTQETGVPTCSPGECTYFIEGICDFIRVGFQEEETSTDESRALEFLDLRSQEPLIIFRKGHNTHHRVFVQGSGGSSTDVNQETPTWLVGGNEQALGPTRDVTDRIGRQITASTDPLGHAIVDWPDFALSRLSPPGDPRVLTGFSTPAGLF